MRKPESGTTFIEFDHLDELVGPVTLELEVDWELTPGLPASRTEPAEEPDFQVTGVRVVIDRGSLPCPDDVLDAFASDGDAVARARARAEEELRERAEMAADDAAHAAMEPDPSP
jgi:hypothetical protein